MFVGMAFGAALGGVLFAQWGWLAVTALASSTAAGALIVRRVSSSRSVCPNPRRAASRQ